MARAGLYYLNQDPAKIAPGIEALVHNELASPTPLPYEILPGASEGATVGSVLSDLGKSLLPLRSQTTALFYVHFTPNWPRSFELQVTVTRRGVGALVGTFAYVVPLNKPVKGAVSLGKAREGFIGDPETIALLNGNRDLITQAHKLAVSRATIGRVTLTIPQYLQVVPRGSGSVLVLRRLGKPGFFSGFNVGAKDLFAFVPQFEACLS